MGEQDGAASAVRGITVEGSAEWVVDSSHVGDKLRVCLFEPVPPAGEPTPLMVLVDGAGMMQTATEFLRMTRLMSLFTAPPVSVVAVTVVADDIMSYLSKRYRDFTPTVWEPRPEQLGPLSIDHGTGGAPRLLDALVEEILPSVQARLAVDESVVGVGGHSLSGLFAAWAWLERPDVFSRVLASSPSLWWDDGALLQVPVATRPPGHRAYLAVGEHEEGPAESMWPPLMRQGQEVHDLNAMVSRCMQLGVRLRETTADVEAVVVPGEQHVTVWATALARGLRHLFLT